MKHGKPTFIAILLALSLTACAADPVKILGTAEVSFTRLVNQADVLAQRPRCGVEDGAPVCIDQAAVDNMVKAAEVGDKALDEGWKAVAQFENGGKDEEALIDAAVSAALGAVEVFNQAVNGFVGGQ